ncbi:UDP-2,3-diacylglucosamine diphosphatase [methane-oxidizing endosymbiont of Gigantopelta aegis]|uniref:UDP-2,3-diacylglucosamine diphosphatase n=1 Tax=methane-oxidizing endosymbiont of Gigantopelta aegis TaxID=2794938 RepID=UPI0018DE8097|nr:UDP-2,3-diacylglucosamine diphosphatase [methane-oxidizing endosymbiont of Gigantopelta aegis]
MNPNILFISDLHIAVEKKEITRRFLSFLQETASQANALYILGDLFDSWIGDDDNLPPNPAIKRALKKLTDTGVAVYFQAGNRDFLIGQAFARETGVTLLGDYHVIDLFGVRTLLTHGDLLCSDDVAYQAFRQKSRQPDWQRNVLSKPLWLRLLAARWYRLRSFWHKRKKNDDIMDVNPQTVIETLKRFDCQRLIHGHTHRPAVHEIMLDGETAQRFVLADWTAASGQYLRWNERGYAIIDLD